MVFLVYNNKDDLINGVYEDEKDAEYACSMLEGFDVRDLPYFKKDTSKVTYTEEDSSVDESHYLDEINMLKNELDAFKKESQMNATKYDIMLNMSGALLFAYLLVNIIAISVIM
jgi:hypothetical protein